MACSFTGSCTIRVFQWRHLECNATVPESVDVYKQRILDECRTLSADTLERVREEFTNSCKEVTAEHFEHLL